MIRSRTPWREKLANSRDLPRVEAVSGKMIERWGKGTFVIPAPLQVDALMRKVRITPHWRTLRTGGELNPKYPGGVERQRLRLEAEGHRVVAWGKKLVVEGYERVLARL